jgi:hypothetical protein
MSAQDWQQGDDLTPIEEEMLNRGEEGELLSRECPFNLSAMPGWGPSRSIRAKVLRHLLVQDTWRVHAKGVHLRGIRVSGRLDLESAVIRCPVRLDGCYFDYDGPIVLDYATASLLALTGCRLAGLKGDRLIVTRELDLKGTTFIGPVHLVGADIAGQLIMRGAQLAGTDQEGSCLIADEIKVGASAFFGSSGEEGTFTAAGAIRLLGAEITGELVMSGARLTGTDRDGDSLVADRVRVGREVFLDSSAAEGTFVAAGAVRLLRADIGDQLTLRGAQLTEADQSGNCLVADGIKVGGSMRLDLSDDLSAFAAAGTIRLSRADINGELTMAGATLQRTDKNEDSLAADGIKVGGDVFLGSTHDALGRERTFNASGSVVLVDAQVGGAVDFTGAELLAAPPKVALKAEGMQITHELVWRPARQVDGQVNLEGGSAAELQDDWTGTRWNGYWPSDLRIAGFTYTRISTPDGVSVEQRLDWIRGTNKDHCQDGHSVSDARTAFASQPYGQLSEVYRRAGSDTETREVAVARRRDLRRLGNLRWHRRAFNWVLDVTIRYGYQTWRALAGLAVLYVAVLLITLVAQHHDGSIVPSRDTTAIHPSPSALKCVSDYPCFFPAGYAFDTVVPIINIHQADYWRPNATVTWGGVCIWLSWAGTVFGWLLVTLAIAGYTGLARRADAT